MKQFVFATLMCISALSAKAQVITSEAVKNAYVTASTQPKSDFVFNADYTDSTLTTMYIYKKHETDKHFQTLTPFKKYDYTYATDGTLTSKVTYQWDADSHRWTCASRHDYTLEAGKYSVIYSIYNPKTNRFEQPVDKMVYSLDPYADTSNVTIYHRNNSTSPLQVVSEIQLTEEPLLFAEK